MCEFCGCSCVRTWQAANETARRGKKPIAIPNIAVPAGSKASKVDGRDAPIVGMAR